MYRLHRTHWRARRQGGEEKGRCMTTSREFRLCSAHSFGSVKEPERVQEDGRDGLKGRRFRSNEMGRIWQKKWSGERQRSQKITKSGRRIFTASKTERLEMAKFDRWSDVPRLQIHIYTLGLGIANTNLLELDSCVSARKSHRQPIYVWLNKNRSSKRRAVNTEHKPNRQGSQTKDPDSIHEIHFKNKKI